LASANAPFSEGVLPKLLPFENRGKSMIRQAFPFARGDQTLDLGMSLREWFAGCALTGILAGKEIYTTKEDTQVMGNIARHCFELADQMLMTSGTTLKP
jgi:hypothetical protein